MAKAAKAKGGKRGMLSMRSSLLILLAIIVVVLFHPTLILLVTGMLPTVAAFIVDRNRGKYATKAVGYLNFCGCLPYLLELWLGANDIDKTFELLSQPLAWLVMFASAAVGWLIVYSVPPVVAAYLSVTGEVKEAALKKRQKDLVDEWGVTVRHQALGSSVESDDEDEADNEAAEEAAD